MVTAAHGPSGSDSSAPSHIIKAGLWVRVRVRVRARMPETAMLETAMLTV